MSRQQELRQGYLGVRELPHYAGDFSYVRKHPYIDFRHSASPIYQSQNSEWINDYRMPGER
jgi:hypothetical protein